MGTVPELGCIIRYHGDILLCGVGKPLSAGFAVDANPWDLLLLVALHQDQIHIVNHGQI